MSPRASGPLPKDPWDERYIYLHLVDLYGKRRYIDMPYMDPMGLCTKNLLPKKRFW